LALLSFAGLVALKTDDHFAVQSFSLQQRHIISQPTVSPNSSAFSSRNASLDLIPLVGKSLLVCCPAGLTYGMFFN